MERKPTKEDGSSSMEGEEGWTDRAMSPLTVLLMAWLLLIATQLLESARRSPH